VSGSIVVAAVQGDVDPVNRQSQSGSEVSGFYDHKNSKGHIAVLSCSGCYSLY
jgi:hypothetical protein